MGLWQLLTPLMVSKLVIKCHYFLLAIGFCLKSKAVYQVFHIKCAGDHNTSYFYL